MQNIKPNTQHGFPMSTFRAFIAIELDELTIKSLAAIQQRLKREPGAQAVRWVAPGGIHLTLKFLGEIERALAPKVGAVMRESVSGEDPFALMVTGLGAFPNLQRPNVIWAGLSGAVAATVRIAQRLEDGCAALGIAREDRPFSPHLTLGRAQRDATPDARRQIGDLIRRQPSGEISRLSVDAICLMRSELRPSGAVYSVVERVALG